MFFGLVFKHTGSLSLKSCLLVRLMELTPHSLCFSSLMLSLNQAYGFEWITVLVNSILI